MNWTRPMLAATWTPSMEIHFPVIASPKIDGIRCMSRLGKAVSRTFKPIPNSYIQSLVSTCPEGCDGELIVPSSSFQKTASSVMSFEGQPNFLYLVFDLWHPTLPFVERLKLLADVDCPPFVVKLEHKICFDFFSLHQFEEECLTKGYEGICFRDPNGLYKCGRSTAREQGLVKMKRFVDDEAVVIGVEERMHNSNPQQPDNFGLSKRSSHQEGQVPTGTLGALIAIHSTFGEIKVGSGFTEEQRVELWKKNLAGRTFTFKYLPHGVKDKPRHPVFKGWRLD